jgi:flagellar biosynthesis protein FlhF
MQIKRFEAKTMTAALKMVKDEFGPEAVILSARSLRQNRGFLGAALRSGVEVTAAMDSGWPAYTATGRMAAERVIPPAAPAAEGAAARRGLFHSLNESLRSFTGRRAAPAPRPGAPTAELEELEELHQHFLSHEVQRDLAADLVAHIKRLPGGDPVLGLDGLRALAAPALQDMGLRDCLEADSPGSQRVLALVGPNGAGKTSLVMKLAAMEALRKGRRVALMTLDDQRIGAVEQLRIYAGLLGVPMAVATSAADARQVLGDWASMDCIIVDTPGVSPGESERRSEVRQILNALTGREVHLVLNAGGRETDLMAVIEAWRSVPVNALAFTRLDESGVYGHLLNVLIRSQLPLSWLSIGPRIPEDLTERSLELLANRLWPVREAYDNRRAPGPRSGGPPAAAPAPAAFVANRSSELYHRPECKWVRKIKRDHLLQFASAAEAESRNFQACRNCSPEVHGPAETEAGLRDKARISAYR